VETCLTPDDQYIAQSIGEVLRSVGGSVAVPKIIEKIPGATYLPVAKVLEKLATQGQIEKVPATSYRNLAYKWVGT
jgi:hypothetical protein